MTDIIDLQADPKLLSDLEKLLEKVNHSGSLDAFVVTLMQQVDHLTECSIGDRTNFETRITVLEAKYKLVMGITSKVGIIILTILLGANVAALAYLIKFLISQMVAAT